MNQATTVDRYSGLSKLLHWLVAVLVFSQLAMGKFFEIDPDKPGDNLFNLHMTVGLTVLALMVVRLAWRLGNPAPPLPSGTPTWQKIAALATHWAFYVLLITLPLSGWTMTLPGAVADGGKEFLAEVHEVIGNIVLALAALHVLAGLKHHFIDRDNVLRRMLPG
jgi:cytochrome b561